MSDAGRTPGGPQRPQRMQPEDVERVLQKLAAEEEATLAAAEALSGTAGEERVSVLSELAPPVSAPRRRPAWWLAPLAAAAILLIFFQFRGGEQTGGGPSGTYLAPEGFGVLGPERPARWERLEWTEPASGTSSFEVRVLDPALDDENGLLLRERVSGLRLVLDVTETRAWPDEILVEIDALDGGGRIVDSAQALLSLSSR